MVTARNTLLSIIWHTWVIGWNDLREQCFPLFKSNQQKNEGVIKGLFNRISITVLGVIMFFVYWMAHTIRSSVYTAQMLKCFIADRYPDSVLVLIQPTFPSQIKDLVGEFAYKPQIKKLLVGCLYFPHAHLICLVWGDEYKIFSNFKEFEVFVKQF